MSKLCCPGSRDSEQGEGCDQLCQKLLIDQTRNTPDWFWDLATWRTARTLTIQGPKSRQEGEDVKAENEDNFWELVCKEEKQGYM